MNSAQLYLELLESGDRLLRALANERKTPRCNPVRPGWTTSHGFLSAARREVERAAAVYAEALRTYRVAMLSELDPLASAPSTMLGRVSNHRQRALVVPTPCGDSRVIVGHASRKYVTHEVW
jgi:hypothetical protein